MSDSHEANEKSDQTAPDQTRRKFIKAAAYVTPTILTLAATPAMAQPGSAKRQWYQVPGADK